MFLVQACSYKSKIDQNYCQKLKFTCIQSDKVVNFKTSKGDFAVKLFGKDNPVTVSNFLENIDNNIYENKKFYKIDRENGDMFEINKKINSEKKIRNCESNVY